MSLACHFLPWVRQGLAAGVRAEDDLASGLPGRASADVTLEVNSQPVNVPVHLYSAGDVTALDPDQIVRTDPPANVMGFEPNYFPLVEFDRPDLPWLFTPAAATTRNRLRPWLVLAVIREQDGVTFEPGAAGALPVVRIEPPARPVDELPDLADSWAWAHAQVLADGGEDLGLALSADSDLNLSRLLCPRRLAPNTRYLACVVPAFETGRKAGLGLTVADADPLAPAWSLADAAPTTIILPVYYHWRFGTAERGDFESLVRRLRGRPLPPAVGTRIMSVEGLGFALPDLGLVRMGGVLRTPNTRLGMVPDDFKESLRTLVNLPAAQRADPQSTPSGEDPLVAPPIYGRFHARQQAVAPDGGQPRWLRRVNLDPRYRVAAGLGTRIVQELQDELMASAWQQLTDIEEANQLRIQAQFAVEVGRKIHQKHLQPLSTDRIYQVVGPLRSRVRLSPHTLETVLAAQRVTPGATSNAMRRVARPQGPVLRRAGLKVKTAGQPTKGTVFLRLAGGGAAVPWAPDLDGMTLRAKVDEEVARLYSAAASRIFSPARTKAEALYTSARRMADYLGQVQRLSLEGVVLHRNAADTETAFDGVRTTLLQRLDPTVTVPARARQRLRGTDGNPVSAEDAVDPAAPMPHPKFQRPMYESIAALSQDLLMPGLSKVPQDTVTLAETDPRFVEAFMIGLNHEMSRELLWRRYPTDQRGTYFGRFWDSSGIPGAPGDQLAPLHEWKPEYRLGENVLGGRGGGRLVLLIRGELLRRYPGAIITVALPQSPPALDPAEEWYPIFRGTLEPDITFLGFELSPTALYTDRDGAPWYIIIQQPPGDTRFGMDVAKTPGAVPATLAHWSDLEWGHVVNSAEELESLSHASLGGRLAGVSRPLSVEQTDAFEWGHNAAQMAAITMQPPVRIAIKATVILPPRPTEEDAQ